MHWPHSPEVHVWVAAEVTKQICPESASIPTVLLAECVGSDWLHCAHVVVSLWLSVTGALAHGASTVTVACGLSCLF